MSAVSQVWAASHSFSVRTNRSAIPLDPASNTPNAHDAHAFFWITHPYHPLSGQRFALVQYRHTWGEHRVYFHDHSGQLCSVPVPWTSLAPADPFVVVSAGRSLFRVVDLLALTTLCRRPPAVPAPDEEER